MWLYFGWIPLVLVGVSIFFRAAMTAFMGIALEIDILSFYNCMPCFMGIVTAIADRASAIAGIMPIEQAMQKYLVLFLVLSRAFGVP